MARPAPDARVAVRPLAELLVGRGLGVVIPDWNSPADDPKTLAVAADVAACIAAAPGEATVS